MIPDAPSDPPRVFVVAPSAVAWTGLRAMLAGPGLEVVGEASALGAESWASRIGADVLLLADEDLLADAAALVSDEDGPRAIVLLADGDRQIPRLRDSAPEGWGVVPTDASPEEIAAVISAAAHGMVVLPRPLADRLPLEGTAVAEEPVEPLTAREGEVLELLSRGLANKTIARELGISEHTVKFHVSSVFGKLSVSSRAEAVGQGARLGLITL